MARQSVTAELPFHRLLRNNDLGIIENPLRRVHEDDLIADIRNFHHEYSLKDIVDVDVLIRGGLLARDEEATVTEGRLSDVEVSALEREKSTRIWDESKELKVILLTCCVGSVVQGWAQGAIVGANQLWPAEFGLIIGLTGPKEPEGHMNDIWRFSATNAIVYFAASSIGALLCDPLTEIFMGRRGALFVAAIMTFTASIGEGFTHSWQVSNSRLLFIFLCTIIAENAGVNAEVHLETCPWHDTAVLTFKMNLGVVRVPISTWNRDGSEIFNHTCFGIRNIARPTKRYCLMVVLVNEFRLI